MRDFASKKLDRICLNFNITYNNIKSNIYYYIIPYSNHLDLTLVNRVPLLVMVIEVGDRGLEPALEVGEEGIDVLINIIPINPINPINRINLIDSRLWRPKLTRFCRSKNKLFVIIFTLNIKKHNSVSVIKNINILYF